jgi:RecA-family ATPase
VRDDKTLIDNIKQQTPATPVAVVIDTLNRSMSGSESSDEDMAAYIKAADAVRAAFGCTVIIVHHCGVDGSRPRGHTSLTGAADAQIAVSRDDPTNEVVVTLEWLKDGAEGDVITSRLELIELGLDEDGEQTTSCVIVAAETEQRTQTTKAKKKEQKSLRVFRLAFTEAIDTAGQTIHAHGNGPAVRAVDLKYVKVQFELRWATGENAMLFARRCRGRLCGC